MIVKLTDLRLDSWASIVQEISKGGDPSKKHLIAALRRQEPSIPGEAQVYLARLINGEVDRRGRPVLTEDQKAIAAGYLVGRVDHWWRVFAVRYKTRNPKQRAFDRVADERG